MIRVVVAVALSAALIGVSLPVVRKAGTAHSDRRVATALDRVESAARTLRARSVGVPRGVTARRVLTLSLPSATWAHPGLARLRFPSPGGDRRVTWRVDGGVEHGRRLLSGDVVGPPGGLTLHEGGPHEVALLLRSNGTVVVRRLRFITRRGSTPAHADTPSVAVHG